MLAGADVQRAPEPRHGFVSTVTHSGEGIFAGIPQGFEVVRYHSLHVDIGDGEVPGITVHARSEDGVVQALKVDGLDHWGVQFHPESVLTQHGEALMRNFLGGWRLIHREVPGALDCPRVFNALKRDGHDAFFLDSADPRGRYSILGDTTGPLSRSFCFSLDDDTPDILTTLERELATPLSLIHISEPTRPY